MKATEKEELEGGTNANPEQEKFELERKKFELEEIKFHHSKNLDYQKLKTDRVAKLWTPLSIFTPMAVFLIGFYLNSGSEQAKREQANREEVIKSKRQFVEKQLAEFYYPIQLRLHKDNAFFTTWRELLLTGGERNIGIAKKIETQFILPNHEEIIKIIDLHFDLIKNDMEFDTATYNLMDTIKVYQRHVAVYKLLKLTGDSRRPAQVKQPFPKPFFRLIEDRIVDLENQRDSLLSVKLENF